MAHTDEYAYENEGTSRPLSLNEYQRRAMTTCMPSSNNFAYMMLNLVGEVGEFFDKVEMHIQGSEVWRKLARVCSYTNDCGILAKRIRKQEVKMDKLNLERLTTHEREELKKEAGDIIWQVAGLCAVMGWKLEDVAQQNLEKLASRQERGKIDGNGDNR